MGDRYHGAVLDTCDDVRGFSFRQPLNAKTARGVVCLLALNIFRRLVPARLDEKFLTLRRGLLSPLRSPHQSTETKFQLQELKDSRKRQSRTHRTSVL